MPSVDLPQVVGFLHVLSGTMMIRVRPLIRWRIFLPARSFGTTLAVFQSPPKSSSPQYAKTDNDGKPKNSLEDDGGVEAAVQERLSKILADVPYSRPSEEKQRVELRSSTPRDIVDHTNTTSDTGTNTDASLNSAKRPEVSATNADVQMQKEGLKTDFHAETPKSNTDYSATTSDGASRNIGKAYTYADIFNIKQIIDTVKESENVKQLQHELTNYYQKKKQEQQALAESLSQRVGQNVVELKRSIRIASKVVNEITGYNKVIKLKDIIVENEQKLKDLKTSIHEAKIEHEKALELRSSSQKEVNELLERKNSWKPVDLDRFTRIYMTTHDLDKTVKELSDKLKYLEDLQESTHDALIRSIMNRYHEEQVWSDKIRQFSTWGTILIMCINLLLVLLVQFVFEPFKRWRLVNSFEDKVKDLFHNSEKLDLDIQQLKEQLDTLNLKSAAPLSQVGAVPPSAALLADPELKSGPEPEPATEEPVTVKQAVLSEQEPLPPFRLIVDRRLDTTTIRKYWRHYYLLTSNWFHQFMQYMTPLAYQSTAPLQTTVGEFQGYVCTSMLASVFLGLLLGRLVA